MPSGVQVFSLLYSNPRLLDLIAEEALKLIESRLQSALSDYRLYQLQARGYAALNKSLQQHRALDQRSDANAPPIGLQKEIERAEGNDHEYERATDPSKPSKSAHRSKRLTQRYINPVPLVASRRIGRTCRFM